MRNRRLDVVEFTEEENQVILEHLTPYFGRLGKFNLDINLQDEMYSYFFHIHKDKTWTNKKLRAALSYYQGAVSIFDSIEKFLVGKNIKLEDQKKILDFASGYGRLSRILTSKLTEAEIFTAEIDHNATLFLSETMGLKGYRTEESPINFNPNQSFDLIICISLFSHLSLPYWNGWFDKLLSIL